MPRINRIRVVNIFYDEDRKLLPDLVFETQGLDAIMLLANGGGKSLLIQLALQVILPNEKMGKRSIKQLLRHHRYTGHVIVEWLLDNEGDGDNYLCTGFCFTEDSRKEFKYFNYLFEYDDVSKYNISSLPLVDSTLFADNVIAYQELRDWINNSKDVHIQLFDQINTYHQVLRSFRILPEEWRNIRETNASEGGVAKFFERGKTTSQLIENILIPGIEEMMFHDELKKKELINAFSNYRKLLLDIPIIKKNLQDFEVIRENAQQVVDVVQKLDQVQKEVENSILHLARLGETFQVHKGQATEQLQQLEEDLEQLKGEEKELVWQELSYEAFIKELDHREACEQEVKVNQDYDAQKLVLGKYEQEQRELEALNSYNKYVQAELEKMNYESLLENMDKSEPELLKKLNQIRTQLRWAWEIKQNNLLTLIERKDVEIEGFDKQIASLKGKIEEARELESECGEQIAALNSWFEQYKNEQKMLLANEVTEEALQEPEEFLEVYQQELQEVIEKIKDCTAKINSWENEKDHISEEISTLNGEKAGTEKELQYLQQSFEAFHTAYETLKELLAGHECYVKDLFEAEDKMLFWIKEQKDSVRSSRLHLEVEKADLEQKWLLLKDYQYYIPHQDLVDIKTRLEKANLFAITGSEWLAEQSLSPDECQAILKNQPLLPYSIIIESSQTNAVKNIIKQLRNLTPDIPLLFLVKNERNLNGSTEIESFISLFENDVYMYQPDSLSIYTSTEAFQNFKSQINDKIASIEGQLAAIIARETDIEYLREQILSFYREYTAEQTSEWKKWEDEKIQRIQEIEKEIQLKKDRSAQLKETIEQHRMKIVELQETSHQRQKLIEMLGRYLPLFVQIDDKHNERDRLSNERDQIKRQINNWDEEKEEFGEKRGKARLELNGLNSNLTQHKHEFTHYRLELVDVIEEIESESLNYDELEGEIDSILEQLKSKQNQRENIENLIKKCQSELDIAKEQIEHSEIEWNWLQEHRREVFKEELTKIEFEVNKKRKDVIGKEKEWHQAKANVQAKKEVWDNVVNSVTKQTDLLPFNEFDPYTHQQQYKVIKNKLGDLHCNKQTIELDQSKVRSWVKENEDALELLAYNLEVQTISQKVFPLTSYEWDKLGVKPKDAVLQSEQMLRVKQDKVTSHKKQADLQFNIYLQKLEKTQNAKVADFIRNVKVIMENNKLYDYDYIETQFIRIFEALDQYQQQYEFNLQETEKNMSHLTDLCLRRAKTVYDNIVEIPKNSRVILFDQEVQIIKMNWPTQSEEENRQKIYGYLDQVLTDLNKWKQEGKLDDEIDSKMAEMLRTRNLIQVIAPIEDCLVSVFKPRKESLVRQSRNDRSPWDEVSNWSGGEGYSIYITMFMTIINHIRQQTEGRQNVWKVIMADNPFGIASSSHILEVVFNVAKANQIQFICFTAHQDENILYSFPVVYSLQLRSAYGKEIMQAERLESGFYRMEV